MRGRTLFKYSNLILPVVDVLVYPFLIITPPIRKFIKVFRYALCYLWLRHFCKKVGLNVLVGSHTVIKSEKGLTIGNNVSIHENCFIDASGGITIGNNVSIAHGSTIMSTNHGWADNSKPIKYNPHISKPVVIHDDVWIASDVKIMAGVTIESRCIIAAGAVVTHNCLSHGLYAGIPAKRIKDI